MPKVKAFDPDAARVEAEKTIDAAIARKAALATKVEAADKKVEAATKAQQAAAATKQKAVDTAKAQRAALQEQIDEQDTLILRQRKFLDATALLHAEPEPQPEPEPAVV